LLGNDGFTPDGGARGVVFRVETRERDDLSGGVEGGDIAELSQELAGGQVADARDGGQQASLALEVRMVVNVVVNKFLELSNLAVKKGELVLELGNDNRRGGLSAQPVAGLLAIGGQILQMADQGLQFLPSRVRRCPGRRLLGATKIGNQLRVQLI